jgi:hypothetical protein
MGCYTSKNTISKTVKSRKLSYKRVNTGKFSLPRGEIENINYEEMSNNNYVKNKLILRRNMFFYIQKKMWIKVLDFLTYKDLCQAGLLNK